MQYDLLSAQTNVSHILLKVTVCDTALQIQYSSTKEANEHVTQRDLKTFAQLNSKSETFEVYTAQCGFDAETNILMHFSGNRYWNSTEILLLAKRDLENAIDS